MGTQIMTVEQRRKALIDLLMPELRDYLNLFHVEEQTLKLIANLPKGRFSHLHGAMETFVENKYIPDLLGKMVSPKSQYQVLNLLKTIIFGFGFPLLGKKIVILYDSSKTKILWLDFSTQKYSLYLGASAREAEENMFFVSGSFFPNQI